MGQAKVLLCPRCGNKKLWRDGVLYSFRTERQRWLCRVCGHRFTEPKVKVDIISKSGKALNSSFDLAEGTISDSDPAVKKIFQSLSFSTSEDVCSHDVTIIGKRLNSFCSYSSSNKYAQGAKNLNPTANIEKALGGKIKIRHLGSNSTAQDVKGKIVELLVYMKRQNYAESTITLFRIALKVLQERGADLADPESVKEVLATACVINNDGTKGKPWSGNRKRNVINAYTFFLKIQGLQWEKPKVKISRSFPFIPSEKELSLIHI